MEARLTRSRSRQRSNEASKDPAEQKDASRSDLLPNAPAGISITQLAESLTTSKTGLSRDTLQLLQLKQSKLRVWLPELQTSLNSSSTRTAKSQDISPTLNPFVQTVAATLVFAQEEAGTAVCISADGLLLTCSHCVAESRADFQEQEQKWLLFASGQVVRAKCVAWDDKRDLALLQIVAAQQLTSATRSGLTFPFISVASSAPKANSHLYCIGHPGSEDLEASTAGVSTDYDVLHISSGRFRGLAGGQDPQDNSEIGALMHDCWTYWGHSGAPLIEKRSRQLVGLHSSWDDQTRMRRGVPLAAITTFLETYDKRDLVSTYSPHLISVS